MAGTEQETRKIIAIKLPDCKTYEYTYSKTWSVIEEANLSSKEKMESSQQSLTFYVSTYTIRAFPHLYTSNFMGIKDKSVELIICVSTLKSLNGNDFKVYVEKVALLCASHPSFMTIKITNDGTDRDELLLEMKKMAPTLDIEYISLSKVKKCSLILPASVKLDRKSKKRKHDTSGSDASCSKVRRLDENRASSEEDNLSDRYSPAVLAQTSQTESRNHELAQQNYELVQQNYALIQQNYELVQQNLALKRQNEALQLENRNLQRQRTPIVPAQSYVWSQQNSSTHFSATMTPPADVSAREVLDRVMRANQGSSSNK